MRALSKYPVLILIINLVLNILLAFFLISILADGILRYKVGFVVSIPIIGLLLFTLVFLFVKYFTSQHSEIRNTTKTKILIVLGAFILIIFSFNLICWIDLFDGKTNALLP